MAKAKRKPKGTGRSNLIKAKNYVRGSNNKLFAVSEVRQSLSGSELKSFASWIASLSSVRPIKDTFFPAEITYINKSGVFKPISNSQLIDWYVGLLDSFSGKLKKFLEIKKDIEKLLKKGELEKTRKMLESVDQEFGCTLWSIRLRVALIAVEEGLEGQKNYVQEILDKNLNGVIRFLVYYWSVRAEDKMAAPRFYQLFEHIVESADLSVPTIAFTEHYLLGNTDVSKNAEDSFYLISGLPLIDQYEFVINYLIELQVENKKIGKWLKLAQLSKLTDCDHRLQKLMAANQDNYTFPETAFNAVFSAREDLLNGIIPNRKSLQTDSLEDTVEINNCFSFFDEASFLDPESSKLVLPGELGEDEAIKLFKKGLMFDSTETGCWLRVVAAKKIFDPNNYDFSFEVKRFFTSEAIDVYGFYEDGLLSKNLAQRLIKEDTSVYVKWHAFMAGVEPSFDQSSCTNDSCYFSSIANLKNLWDQEEYEEVILQTHRIIVGEKFLDPSTAMSYQIKAKIELGNIEGALKDIVDFYFFRLDVARSLPFDKLNKAISKSERHSISSNIELPIFYHILVEEFGADVSSLRAYSYEDFLISKGVCKPSEESKIYGCIDRKKVIFYLKNICVQEVMQFSFYFQKSKELEDERIRVCNLLADLDPMNATIYEEELRNLVRNSHIQSAIKQLRQSKISIDENEIRKWAGENLKQDYERLQDLIRSGQRITREGFKETLLNALKGDVIEPSAFSVPENESGQLLKELLSSFIRESYSNQEHGLDCYLSMRIRHGTLSGQLRNPVEEEFLITKRSSDDGKYHENEFWKRRLEGRLTKGDLEEVLFFLETFSVEIDEYIEYVTENLIQIKSPKKTSGLFEPLIPTTNIMALAYDIESGLSFDDFVDSAFQVFWTIVEADLKRVRAFFVSSGKDNFKAIFANLESKFEKFESDEVLLNLKDASKLCFTRLSSALDRVSEWFELPKPANDITFAMDELIEVGLESVKALHSDFDPIIKKDVSDIPKLSNALNLFSDMFFIIFENIYKHGGISTDPTVRVYCELDGDNIVTTVKNELDLSDADIERNIQKLNDVRHRLYGREYGQALRSEGGTGFFKLRKLIEGDGSVESRLEFGIEDNLFFVVVRNHVSILDVKE